MGTIIYYYTGTGNSLWAARKLAEEIKDVEVLNLSFQKDDIEKINSERIGIVFPVHMWGLPKRIINFIKTLPIDKSKYYFAVATNAGQVAATLIQLKKLMAERGIVLSAGFDFVMPSNYIPWGGAATEEKQKLLFKKAEEKIKRISETINGKTVSPVERGPLWHNVFLSGVLYKISSPQIPKMDKSFWADEKCSGCGICEKICPAKNISLNNGRPVWHHNCEQCLACIQWCPEESIQFGKKTIQYDRYHHPEIKLGDMVKP